MYSINKEERSLIKSDFQCWGGALITNYMLGQTPVQFLSIHPLLNYVGVYLFVTLALRHVSAPAAKTIDTTVVLLDGSLRMHAVISSITMVTSHSNAAIRNSLPLQVLLATIGATGGGQLALMLGVHSPHGWSLHTPPALRATSPVEVIDIVMAFVCSLVYGLTTLSHPSYAPILARIYNDSGKPLFTPLGARAACTLLFSAGFAYRAAVLHWFPASSNITTRTKANGSSSSRSK